MAVTLHEKHIGEAKWSLNSLATTKGLACLTHILSLIGGPLATIVGDSKDDTDGGIKSMIDRQVDAKMLGLAVAQLVQALDSKRTIETVQTLLGGLLKDGHKVEFDLEFAQNYTTLVSVLLWAVEINYADFFAASQGPFAGLLAKAKTMASGPSIATGGSGA